ncbi:patatin-like phospholipase family protein [Deltaproteobacteria bacterium TL4]
MNKEVQIKKLKKAMKTANSYEQWLEYAKNLDHLEGKDLWRAQDESEFYHPDLIQQHLQKIRQYLEDKDFEGLSHILHESLYRNLAEISSPELYQYAHAGTKHLITEYLEVIETAMMFLCDCDVPHISLDQKLHLFTQAQHNFGRTALMLSGGASFGIYHLGVVKSLWEQKLLPKIISGASMGSIVAAGICSRSDAELDDFFLHPERIHRIALKRLKLSEIIQQRMMMDPEQLMEHIEENVGIYTFKEAFERSGRVLNITVSPTRSRQKPRVLNHLTAPDVIIAYSALASCAIPGVFPPVSLMAKVSSGEKLPYMPTEKWIDGSVHSDLPLLRISRLHNVNHSIVSQANPHVLPFITHRRKKGMLPFAKHVASSFVHARTTETLEIARDVWQDSPWRLLLDKAYAMAKQTYLGDINIQFPFNPLMYRKIASNPDLEGIHAYISLGEHATWPQISIIQDQTRISRTFESCIQKLNERVHKETKS